jgi:predicted transposase YdaD
MKGRKEGRKEGRKDGRKEGRKAKVNVCHLPCYLQAAPF